MRIIVYLYYTYIICVYIEINHKTRYIIFFSYSRIYDSLSVCHFRDVSYYSIQVGSFAVLVYTLCIIGGSSTRSKVTYISALWLFAALQSGRVSSMPVTRFFLGS